MASGQSYTMRQSLALVWRTLRSMRTALILLLLLALASVGGSLLPQVPNTPERVARYLVDHPFWGDLFRRAGLFDVFGSWWFGLIVTLLFISLVACLIPRTRALVRALRQRPVQAAELDSLPHYAERSVGASPEQVVGAASAVLRRRFFRVEAEGTALAAEKGSLREAGSLLFHWAFILLLAGVIVGKGTGYSGRATVVEGQTWVDAPANYDGTLRPGRWSSEHSGVAIELLEFRNDFRESGVPMDFVSQVELSGPDPGSEAVTTEVRVNGPVRFGPIRIFQYGFGWAPVLRVESGGEAIFDGPVVMGQVRAPDGVSQLAMPWLGVVKLPSETPQVAVSLELWPDGRAFLGDGTVPMTTEFAPVMRYSVWEGDLGAPSLGSLDTRLMEETGSGLLAGGWWADLRRACVLSGPEAPGDAALCAEGTPRLTMGFTDVRRYSVFQVSKDAGVPVVLAAAILLLLGLMPALYTSRRKVWVRARAGEGGTTVEVGGSALQRKAQFENEFAALVDAIVTAGRAPDG